MEQPHQPTVPQGHEWAQVGRAAWGLRRYGLAQRTPASACLPVCLYASPFQPPKRMPPLRCSDYTPAELSSMLMRRSDPRRARTRGGGVSVGGAAAAAAAAAAGTKAGPLPNEWNWVTRGKVQASKPRLLEKNFDRGSWKAGPSDSHAGNFLACVRSREACIAPAEQAHRSITPGHLGYVSAALHRPLTWDAKNEVITSDAEADQLLKAASHRLPRA